MTDSADSIFDAIVHRYLMHYHASRVLVVAGTDTDVGKTWVTGQLARAYMRAELPVVTQKWVQTGPGPSDIASHDRISGLTFPDREADRLPYWFSDPVSPHLAAVRMSTKINIAQCFSATERLRDTGHVLLEGAGGLAVPYTPDALWIDVLGKANWPVLLVAPNRVGVLNHVFLSTMALCQRNISVLGVVLNQLTAVDSWILDDNADTLARFLGVSVWQIRRNDL